jgi:drug/metabolite transporter (DMT)-like permease
VLRPLSQAYGAIPATAASTVMGSLPYLAFAGTLSGPALAHLDPAVWGELAFLALGSTTAGLLLWNVAVLSGGTTRVSLLLYLEPVVSVLGAAAFLGEHVKPVTIAGGLLIMGGVATASSSAGGGVASQHGRDDAFHQAGGMPGAGTAGADGGCG